MEVETHRQQKILNQRCTLDFVILSDQIELKTYLENEYALKHRLR